MTNPFEDICKTHDRIAMINDCIIDHHGFVLLDDVIVSKTNRGFLETQLSEQGYSHALTGFDNVLISLIAD